jgi:hypothetical protein
MPALLLRRKAFLAWLATLAILWHAVPFAGGTGPAGDASIHHLDICSSHAGGSIDAGVDGSGPSKHHPGKHECTLCAPAMAQITAPRSPDVVARRPVPAIAGTTGAGIVPWLAAALPPPPCGPPVSAA